MSNHDWVTTENRGYLIIYCNKCALVAQDWSTSDAKRAELKKELESKPYCTPTQSEQTKRAE